MPVRFVRVLAPLILLSAAWVVAADDSQGLPPGTVALKGHTETIYALAYTPDGRSVVTASFDKTLKVWDAATGKEIRSYGGPQGHQGLVLAVGLTPDGLGFVSGGADNNARLWDFPASTPTRTLTHTAAVLGVALSPDGKTLAGAGQDGTLRVWTATDGKMVAELKGHSGAVTGIGFLPNGQMLATSGVDRTVRFWDIAKGQMLASYGTPAPPTSLTIHPNGASVLSVTEDGSLTTWRLPAEATRILTASSGPIRSFFLSADGNQILTGTPEGAVRATAFAGGQVLRAWKGPTSGVASVALSPNGALAAAGTGDQKLFLWNGANDTLLGQALAHEGSVNAVAFSPGSNQLLTGGGDGRVKTWLLPPVAEKVLAHPEGVLAAVLAADGKRAATGSADKVVRTWNLAAPGQPERQYTGHTGPVTAVALSANGQQLASGSADQTIHLWNQANGQSAGRIGAHGAPLTTLSFAPSGQQLLSSALDGSIKVWQLPLVAPRPLAHADQVTSLAVSPDGSRLLTGGADKTAALWNLTTSTVERRFGGMGLAVTCVAYSSNGASVAAGGADRSVLVWNAADGKEVKKFAGLPAAVTGIVFGAEGKIVAAGLGDGSVRLLDIASGKETKNLSAGAPIVAVTATPKGDLVLAAAGKSVKAWSMPEGMPRPDVSLDSPVAAMAVNREGTRLALGAATEVRLITLADGKTVGTIKTSSEVRSISFAPDGLRVVIGGADGQARVYGLDGRLVEFFTHPGAVVATAYHPDGKRIVSAGGDKAAHLWQPAMLWQGNHEGPVRQTQHTPRGDQILSVGEDKTLRVWNVADGKPIRSAPVHEAAVTGLGISPDGTKVATASADRTVKIWPGTGDKPLLSRTLAGPVRALAFGHNGTRVAVAVDMGGKSLVHILDATTGKDLQSYSDHSGAVTALAFSSDMRQLLSAGLDKTTRISDVAVTAALEAHPGGVAALVYHSNGAQALSGGADRTVKLWELATGKVLRTFGPLDEAVTAVAFSRDFAHAGAAAGKTVTLWNVADGKTVTTLAHPAAVTSLAYNADRTRLLTSSADGLARLWDLTSGKVLQVYTHTGPVTGVAFHPNNQHVVTAGTDKALLVHPIAAQRIMSASAKALRGVTVIPAQSHALTVGEEGVAHVWNLGNGTRERSLEGANGPLQAVTMARNGVLIATGGAEGIVRLYTYGDGKLVGQFKAPGPIRALAFSVNNQALAAACADRSLVTWNVVYNPGQPAPADFGRVLQTFAHDAAAHDVVFAPDNLSFYSAGADNAVKAWKFASETPTKAFGHPREVDSVAVDPTGKTLATGCHDGNVRLFDLIKGQQLKEIKAHAPAMPPNQNQTNPVYAVAWDPAGKTVVSASMDASLKLWDAAGGNLVKEFKAYKEKDFEKGHRAAVFCVAMSPDGKFLASGSAGQERLIKLWNVADGSVVRDFVNPALKPPAGISGQAHPGWVYGVRFTPDGKYLVSVGAAPRLRGSLAVWNVADGKLLHAREIDGGTLHAVAVSPDGKTLAVAAGKNGGSAQSANACYLIPLSAAIAKSP